MSVGPRKIRSNGGETSARSCANCCSASGAAPADIAAVGVAGMLPAVVLLDSAGRLLRPSIQQSDARCGAEVDELRAEIDEQAFLAKAGNGVNQQLVAPKLRWIERHEPEVFSRIGTVFGSYDYINWRLTGERAIEQNWALGGGVRRLEDARDRRRVWSRLRTFRAPPCRARSRRTKFSASFQARARRKPDLSRERRSSAARRT